MLLNSTQVLSALKDRNSVRLLGPTDAATRAPTVAMGLNRPAEPVAAELAKHGIMTGGGDFYNNQNARVGKLFATSVIRAAKEGRIGFKQAYELTGLNGGAFQKYASRLGLLACRPLPCPEVRQNRNLPYPAPAS